MYWDWPGGVALVRRVVNVTSVPDPCGRVVAATFMEMY